MAKVKVEITREQSEPSTTIVVNLKESKVGTPWVFKCGQTKMQEEAKRINELFNDRKEWQKNWIEFLIAQTRYAPIPERPVGFDTLEFGENLEIISDALRDEFKIAQGKPKQRKLVQEQED